MTDNAPQPELTLADALTQHYNAKQALAYWQAEEKRLRYLFADILCKDDGDYKNKTLPLADGSKLKLNVKRSVKVDTQNDVYLEFIKTMIGNPMSRARLDAFMKETRKTVVSFSATGYDGLTDEEKEAISGLTTVSSDVTIGYEQPTEQR